MIPLMLLYRLVIGRWWKLALLTAGPVWILILLVDSQWRNQLTEVGWFSTLVGALLLATLMLLSA
ncbi:hypothetical protein [Nesterenkonia ebinurensis]|uniref:hypothetical protein n=1 Tax=Nesterenkonia ebinurensis TaxID=2608252 RepID=UPI00123E120C|nr:hypothetical protein [Nesterenkonia ebinurensis]